MAENFLRNRKRFAMELSLGDGRMSRRKVIAGGQGSRLLRMLRDHPELAARFARVRRFGNSVRTSEVHVTNACDLRCVGCWFYKYEFERRTREEHRPSVWNEFIKRQAASGITHQLLIGGEPTLYPDRIAAFAEVIKYLTISTNGIRALPRAGFEQVAIAISVFGGDKYDDRLRGIRANGERIGGLFQGALDNYRDDERAVFVYAVSAETLDCIDDTIIRIEDNGNKVTFNYYISHNGLKDVQSEGEKRLLEKALNARQAHPETVLCNEEFIATLISGRSEFGVFGYEVCPSVSSLHPVHERRRKNGKPVLPNFNSYAADLESLNFCCTSGQCSTCRDSQAVYSWLLLSVRHYMRSVEGIRRWVEIAESYWRHFVWSPFHWSTGDFR